MTDEEFIAELEACRLPERSFDHAAHVRAGYVYLRRHAFPHAAARMCTTVKTYSSSIGKPRLYHETITMAFLAIIHARLYRDGDAGGWEAFRSHHPDLLRKDALLAYYPQSVLDSAEARARFVLPAAGGRDAPA